MKPRTLIHNNVLQKLLPPSSTLKLEAAQVPPKLGNHLLDYTASHNTFTVTTNEQISLALTLCICIPHVLGSNLDLDTGYSE
jgi:hypothetical protein